MILRGLCTHPNIVMNTPVFDVRDQALLDNPIWSSLNTSHAHLALGAHTGHGLARRYPSEIGPLSAFLAQTPEAYADLATLIPEGDLAVLFLNEMPAPPPGWQLLRDGPLVQMICLQPPAPSTLDAQIIRLEPEDFSEMVELATLTEPGPFREQTATLGGFIGIRVDGRLAAMAGQRLSPTDFAEVSGVCTHPDFRGRGYAQALVTQVSRNIHADGRIPFLTSFEANVGAIRVYKQVGYTLRRSFQLAVLKPPSA